MKRTTIHIILLILLLPAGMRAQEVGISAGFGMSAQRMDDLKALQRYVSSLEVVGLETISSFPEYAMTSVSLYYQLYESIRIGAGYVFASTGARSNYTDYTGEISWDILASSHRLGAFLSYAVLDGERYDLSVYGRVDANISRVTLSRTIYVMGYGTRQNEKYGGVKAGFTAGTEFLWHFRDFSLGVDGGYMLDLPASLSSLDSGGDLTIPSGGAPMVITADWTGWRAQAKAIIWLHF
jgi:hypothetical protein